MAQRRARAIHFVGRHRCAHAAAANQNSPLHMPASDCARERDCEVGIVVLGVEYRVSEIDDLMSVRHELLGKLLLHFKTAVIRADPYSHMPPFSPESLCRVI